ncbi:hypothetical protein FSARC_351 [Fusarium sarcochroum]|uniref:Heterokaryon incompatibility domain-containing protein n=1 Tax=Fusarium sarcochroum TaxID=1208366 RepID=A0A8H4UCB9_9HYPO|nr:hypothetical protein FSARC_351 [Fusarium sarcochroum]
MADTNLCRNCRHVLSELNASRSRVTPHHSDYTDLMASVASGCGICRWLSLQLPPPSNNYPAGRRTFQTTCDFDEHTISRSGDGKVKFQGECSWALPFDIEVCIFSSEIASSDFQDTASVTTRKHLPSPETATLEGTTIGSDESLHKVNSWLDSCVTSHLYCSKSTDSSFFPTRIIDVQSVYSGTIVLRDKQEVFGTNTGNTDSTGTQADAPRYWTLSHRWGDPTKVLQLNRGESKDTPSNEAHFRSGVNLDELSPTFRDAVQLVHKLGYRYIWIDSLCIFQDSASDWKHEAAMMKDVYGNSFCNISAIRSSNDTSLGLFGPRFTEPKLFWPFSVDMEFRIWGELRPGKWNFWYNSLLTKDLNSSPLSSRGWVVQERFLARRIIHFTKTQMYWECLDHSRCETDSDGDSGLLETEIQTREYKATLQKIVKQSTLRDARQTHSAELSSFEYEWPTPRGCWRVMVEAYSRCNLTRESDRLIAISGVAKRFEQFYVDDKYLAGLWRNSIHTDLMWESNAFTGAPVRRDVSVAPSWSWASLHGGSITVHTAHQRFGGEPSSLIEFVDARIRSEGQGSDSTSPQESSELDIMGSLYFYKQTGKSDAVDIFSDEELSKSLIAGGTVQVRFDTEELVRKHQQEYNYKGACIPIHSGYIAYGGHEVAFLLVEHVSGSVYKRIGKMFGRGGGWYISGGSWGSKDRTHFTLV